MLILPHLVYMGIILLHDIACTTRDRCILLLFFSSNSFLFLPIMLKIFLEVAKFSFKVNTLIVLLKYINPILYKILWVHHSITVY